MFKLIAQILKTSFFVVLILVLGNLIHWKGETISDQIKMGLSSASSGDWVESAREWASDLMRDSKQGSRRSKLSVERTDPPVARSPGASEFSGSERQKLRALIRELNQGRSQN